MAAILASIIRVVNAGTLVVEDSSVPRLSEHATLEGCATNGTSFTLILEMLR